MNEQSICDDRDLSNEAAIERYAERFADDMGLRDRSWSCGDERRDYLADLVEAGRRKHLLSNEETTYFRECLNDLAAPPPDSERQTMSVQIEPLPKPIADFLGGLKDKHDRAVDRFETLAIRALEIAEHFVNRPPGRRDWENGALQDEVHDVMEFVVKMGPLIRDAKANRDKSKEASKR